MSARRTTSSSSESEEDEKRLVECELERARKRNGKGKGKERERVLRSRREGEAEEEGDVRRPGRRKMKSVGKMGRSREYQQLSDDDPDYDTPPSSRQTYFSHRHRRRRLPSRAYEDDYDRDRGSGSSSSVSSAQYSNYHSDEDYPSPSRKQKSLLGKTVWLLGGLTIVVLLVLLIVFFVMRSNVQATTSDKTASGQVTTTGGGVVAVTGGQATATGGGGTTKATAGGGTTKVPTATTAAGGTGSGEETTGNGTKPSATQTAVNSTATGTNPGSTEGGLSEEKIKLLQSSLDTAATDSWVAGTYAQALLELNSFSPFTSGFSITSPSGTPPSSLLSLIGKWSSLKPGDGQLANGDGSSGDPASLGVGWIVAVQAGQEKQSDVDSEESYLTDTAPKSDSGAISHRGDQVKLWADFVYMAPPFLAYYGAAYAKEDVLLEGYTQCKLYRSALQDGSTKLWKHIPGQDDGLWGTGNAWAAAGMARVLATILASSSASTMSSQVSDLATWINEILVATFSKITDTDLLPNYYNYDSFTDAASSALLAATSFRLATLGQTQDEGNLAVAERIRVVVNGLIQSDGWVKGCVDPFTWKDPSDKSPEGMAFVLLLQIAWSDYQSTQK